MTFIAREYFRLHCYCFIIWNEHVKASQATLGLKQEMLTKRQLCICKCLLYKVRYCFLHKLFWLDRLKNATFPS